MTPSKTVLVPEAGASGMVAVIRSLGRAGYAVHAVSPDPAAIGLRSRWAARASVHPPYGSAEYIPWLREYVAREGVAAIVPSEGFYLAIADDFAEFADLLAVDSDKETIYKCLCKADVFGSFLEAGSDLATRIPPSLVVERSRLDEIDQFIRDVEPPYFVKGDGYHHETRQKSLVRKVDSGADLRGFVESQLDEFSRILVQGAAVGRKATVNVLSSAGDILADSMALAIHESPHTGGLTSLRHTWWHDEMYADALMRLDHLGWNGPAMVEYKWDDETGTFCFIELNSRFWAALHLDLFAGRDFPKIQMEAFFGGSPEAERQRLPYVVACQTTPAEAGHVLSLLKDGDIGWFRKLAEVMGFIGNIIDPRVRSDYFFPGDRALYFRAWWQFLRNLLR